LHNPANKQINQQSENITPLAEVIKQKEMIAQWSSTLFTVQKYYSQNW